MYGVKIAKSEIWDWFIKLKPMLYFMDSSVRQRLLRNKRLNLNLGSLRKSVYFKIVN